MVSAAMCFIGFTAPILTQEMLSVCGLAPHTFDRDQVTTQTNQLLDMKVNPAQDFSCEWDQD